MEDNQKYKTSNKRIAKNTFYLYLRMLMVMIVSLFTVRVVLNSLGAEDYGINNVVGGIVTMFAFLSSTLNSASLRFFAYSIGKNDIAKLSQYFTMSFWCFAIIATIILLLAESIGLWFVLNKLTIPEGRMNAALWAYQFSIFTFVLKILVVPYHSIVIAHEKMNMFAILGVIECFLKLGIAYLIFVSPFDKLKTYSALLFTMGAIIDFYYVVYDIKNFQETHIIKYWNKTIFLEVSSYSGWTLFGTLSGVVRSQGINILLNMFFNPVVNAARAIAYHINSNINHFVINFYKAVQPQITKSYGAGEISSMHSLIFRSSRFSFFLILIISLPVLLETKYLLSIWLKDFPDYTIIFTRLVIIIAIIDSISYPLQTAISATGKIRLYQFLIGGLLIMNLPIAWLFLHFGYPPESTMYIAMALSLIAQIIRITFVKKRINLSIERYIKDVISKIIVVTLASLLLPTVFHLKTEETFTRVAVVTCSSIVSTIIMIWTIGITPNERLYFKQIIKSKIIKI